MKRLFRAILSYSSRRLALQLFAPVVAAGILFIAGYKLAGFLVFQLFIEMFVLWHFAIGITLWRVEQRSFLKFLFVFNMLFALMYRLGTNAWQAVFFYHHGHFPEIEKLLWLIPVHIYASFGSVYCFYLNAKWIKRNEAAIGITSTPRLKTTFFHLLFFPYGLWYIQPRLNIIEINAAISRHSYC